MDEKKHGQIVDSLKKIDPKVIAEVLREILRSDEETPVIRRSTIKPEQNSPK